MTQTKTVNGIPCIWPDMRVVGYNKVRHEGTPVVLNCRETYFRDFDALRRWIEQLPDQRFEKCPVDAASVHEIATMRDYVDTPEGRDHAECSVANEIGMRLYDLLTRTDGPIYWDVPLAVETFEIKVVDQWVEGGPFHHAVTDRMCTIKPGRFASTTARCRVCRASA